MSTSAGDGLPAGICARPYQRSGALVLEAGRSFHVLRPRDEYTPYRLTRCLPLGGMWRVTSAMKSKMLFTHIFDNLFLSNELAISGIFSAM